MLSPDDIQIIEPASGVTYFDDFDDEDFRKMFQHSFSVVLHSPETHRKSKLPRYYHQFNAVLLRPLSFSLFLDRYLKADSHKIQSFWFHNFNLFLFGSIVDSENNCNGRLKLNFKIGE